MTFFTFGSMCTGWNFSLNLLSKFPKHLKHGMGPISAIKKPMLWCHTSQWWPRPNQRNTGASSRPRGGSRDQKLVGQIDLMKSGDKAAIHP